MGGTSYTVILWVVKKAPIYTEGFHVEISHLVTPLSSISSATSESRLANVGIVLLDLVLVILHLLSLLSPLYKASTKPVRGCRIRYGFFTKSVCIKAKILGKTARLYIVDTLLEPPGRHCASEAQSRTITLYLLHLLHLISVWSFSYNLFPLHDPSFMGLCRKECVPSESASIRFKECR